MAVKIRLARFGSKKKPFYRIVAADSEAKRDGRFLEVIGTYDPRDTVSGLKLDLAKLQVWASKVERECWNEGTCRIYCQSTCGQP